MRVHGLGRLGRCERVGGGGKRKPGRERGSGPWGSWARRWMGSWAKRGVVCLSPFFLLFIFLKHFPNRI